TDPARTPDEWSIALGAFLLHAGHSPNEIKAAIVASVAPGVTESLSEGVRRLAGVPVHTVTASSPLPIRLDVEEPLTVGADRIINALAAIDRYGCDTVVVDFGTATTFDCITADGRFIGGVIMPGLRTSADQLSRRAAKLPATELRPPERVIGRRTEECIRAGVLLGTADAVDGLVGRIQAEWPTGRRPKVVATGGLAGTIVPLTRSIEEVVPDLTLQGLRLAAAHLGVRW
ncbi:MAG: type III pantothenate kinase, partial [Gemmatimonadota bacterium]|nr:type III pantothenate kinase [Gemmatimonadota bacterium]